MRTLRSLALPVGLIAVAVGCGGNQNPNTARVRGIITYQSGPVKGGVIRYISGDGTGMAQGPILRDGTYEIVELPPGKMTVVIETESFNPDRKQPSYGGGRGKQSTLDKQKSERVKASGAASDEPGAGDVAAVNGAAKKEMAERYVKIPGKYSAEQTSPLKVELKSGSNTFDFVLTD